MYSKQQPLLASQRHKLLLCCIQQQCFSQGPQHSANHFLTPFLATSAPCLLCNLQKQKQYKHLSVESFLKDEDGWEIMDIMRNHIKPLLLAGAQVQNAEVVVRCGHIEDVVGFINKTTADHQDMMTGSDVFNAVSEFVMGGREGWRKGGREGGWRRPRRVSRCTMSGGGAKTVCVFNCRVVCHHTPPHPPPGSFTTAC